MSDTLQLKRSGFCDPSRPPIASNFFEFQRISCEFHGIARDSTISLDFIVFKWIHVISKNVIEILWISCNVFGIQSMVLCYIVNRCCNILYYTVCRYAVSYTLYYLLYTILYYSILYYNIPWYTILYCTILYYTIL